ncbi:Lsr2 family DNA-binding protein [Streptomyces sp. NPDC003480]
MPENLPPTSPRTPVPDARQPRPATGVVSVAEVRAWAREHGMDVPPRGRLRAEIWNAWHTTHPATGGHPTSSISRRT